MREYRARREGDAVRAKQREANIDEIVWKAAEKGLRAGEGAGSRPAVWEWPRSGGRVIANVLTRYSGPRCLPQVVPRSEMTNDEDASMAEHQRAARNGDVGYTAPESPSRLVDFEFKECKTEPDDSDSATEDLTEVRKLMGFS